MRNYNHHKSSDKIGSGREIVSSKSSNFAEFFVGDHEYFFSSIGLISFIVNFTKNIKCLMLEVAKVLKLTLFSVRSVKSFTPAFSQIFPVNP